MRLAAKVHFVRLVRWAMFGSAMFFATTQFCHAQYVNGIGRIDSGEDDLVVTLNAGTIASNQRGETRNFDSLFRTGVDTAGGGIILRSNGDDGFADIYSLHSLTAIAPLNTYVAAIQLDTTASVLGVVNREGEVRRSYAISSTNADSGGDFDLRVNPDLRAGRYAIESIFDISLSGWPQISVGEVVFTKQIGGSWIRLEYVPELDLWFQTGVMMEGRTSRDLTDFIPGHNIRVTELAFEIVRPGQILGVSGSTVYEFRRNIMEPDDGTFFMDFNIFNLGTTRLKRIR